MKIGFTGTQDGMTPAQKALLKQLLIDVNVAEVHHGDCIGADADAHAIAALRNVHTVLHPPTYNGKRAFCEAAEERLPKPYLQRNHDIVDETDALVATPKGFDEELRSGTWATVRYARKRSKPIWIVYPDGSVKEERP